MSASAVDLPFGATGASSTQNVSKWELGDYELPILIRETALRIFAHQVGRIRLIKILTEDEPLHNNPEFLNLVQTELNAVSWLRQTNENPEINSTLQNFRRDATKLALNRNQQEIAEYLTCVMFTEESWKKFEWKLILMFFDFVCQYSSSSINTPVDEPGKHSTVGIERLQTSCKNMIEAVFFGIGGNTFLCNSWETCWISVTKLQKRKDTAVDEAYEVECIMKTELKGDPKGSMAPSSTSSPFKLSFAHITREVACFLLSYVEKTPNIRQFLTRVPHFDNLAHYKLIIRVVTEKLKKKDRTGDLPSNSPCLEELKLCERLFHLCPSTRYHFAVRRVVDDALISVMMKQRGKACWDTMLSLFHHVGLAVEHIVKHTSHRLPVKMKLNQALLEAIYSLLAEANPPPELQTYRYLLNHQNEL